MCFDEIYCLKYHFSECSIFFGLKIFFYSLLPHLNLSPITTGKRPFDSCIACNMLVMEMRLKSKLMVEHIH